MKIDFHAHILPDMDHGCVDTEMAIAQLKLAKEANMDLVVGTPHFYAHVDTLESFLRRREEAFASLKKCMEGLELPEVICGAEVLLGPHMERMDGLERLCVEGTNVLLLEMPFRHWDDALVDTAIAIQNRGDLQVVLAHVDRYDEARVTPLLEAGLLAQLNASSICKFTKRKRCKYYLSTGSVVALGSDIHLTSDAYRKMNRAERILKGKAAEIYCSTQTLLRRQ